MGGDNAPYAIIDGSLRALSDFSDIDVVLCGDKKTIEPQIEKYNGDKSRITISDAPDIIDMCDSPVKAVKEKPNSSMVTALKLLSESEDAMLISAGNTGALVAGATLIVKRIKGIKRPALSPILPTKKEPVLLIDGGANVDCKPIYLLQFALMGSIYMRCVFNRANPRIGLINNGSEAGKGDVLTKAAYDLLSNSSLNFSGNAEGRELLTGEYDVIVCDGFLGNILLKFLEGCGDTLLGMLKGYIISNTSAKFGYLFMKKAFRKFRKKMDYKEYGGALLLGVNGGVMKAHGSSDATAVYHAVAASRKFLLSSVVKNIKDEITAFGEQSDVREKGEDD